MALPVFKTVRGVVMPSRVGSIPTRSRIAADASRRILFAARLGYLFAQRRAPDLIGVGLSHRQRGLKLIALL